MLQASWQPWPKCWRHLSKVNQEVSVIVLNYFTVDFLFRLCQCGLFLHFALTGCSSAVSTAGCPPGRNAGFTKNLATLTELPDFRPEERSQRERTCADSEQKSTTDGRTKPLSHLDIPATTKEETSVDEGMKPQTAYTNQPSYKPFHQMASPACMDNVRVSVRCKSRDLYMQGGDSRKAENHPASQNQSKLVLIQEAPVRDDKQTDWSMTSADSDTDFQVPRLSYSGKKVEPVKPFSVSSVSASNIGEFGSLSPNVSDLTVYNEIAKKTPHTETFAHAKRSTQREPTPGSECEKEQGVWSRPLFSELKQRQQDSGFDSPSTNRNDK